MQFNFYVFNKNSLYISYKCCHPYVRLMSVKHQSVQLSNKCLFGTMMSQMKEEMTQESGSVPCIPSYSVRRRQQMLWDDELALRMRMRRLENSFQDLQQAWRDAKLRCQCGIFHHHLPGQQCSSGPSSMTTSTESLRSNGTRSMESIQPETTAPTQDSTASQPSQDTVSVEIGSIEVGGIVVRNVKMNMSKDALTSFMNGHGTTSYMASARTATGHTSRATFTQNNLSP